MKINKCIKDIRDKKKIFNEARGITLIALVIIIIVLLILASISVHVLTGDNGILTKTETAVKSNNDAQEKEKVKLAATAAKLTGQGTITIDYLNNELRNIFNNKVIEVEERSDGWLFIGNKEYIIYKNGEVEEIIEIKEENIALLPKEYQQVEYIESTGTQYIDTGIYPSSDSKVITEVSIGEGNKKSAIFGSRIRVGGQPWRKYAILCFANVNETLNSFRCDWGSVQETDIINISDKEKNKIICNKDGWYINDIKINSFSGETWNSGDSPTLTIFCDHESGTVSGYTAKFIGKIYYFQIYNNNQLELNLIPCYSKTPVIDVEGFEQQKGTIGMYDIVNGKFFVNKGEGTFNKGKAV